MASVFIEGILARQEPWSDFPFVVLSEIESRRRTEDSLKRLGNVTVLERPIRKRTLLAAVRAALRARGRQYDGRQAIRDRDEFLAMLGHELRNPLGAILFASEVAARTVKPGDPFARQREIIDRQARRLVGIVDDLLDVSRVTTGKVQLKRERLDLRRVLQQSIESTFVSRPGSAQIVMHEASEEIPVDADPIRVEQILTNLLTNAQKYTPKEGRIDADAFVEGRMAVVRVRDTGVGLAPEMLERIFDLFAQVDTTIDRSRGGMGIGLTLVRSLVELHGGSVSARSDGVGRGAEFTVRLPLTTSSGAAVSAPRETAVPAVVRRRIVLVEDNDDLRSSFRELLERVGHEVTEASDGLEGVETVVLERPDVAIVDIGLPGIDGYEVARRVRARVGRSVLLIALTGYGQESDRAKALAAGFDRHLTKPIDVRLVEHLLL